MSRKYTAQEMRDMAEQILHADDDWYEDAGHMLIQAADKFELEATCEKSSAVGNAAAMREALLKASVVLKEATHHNLTEEYINECLALLHSALSAPPRNFDVGTEKNQNDRFESFCAIHFRYSADNPCSGCPVYKDGDSLPCVFRFLQLPYDVEEK